MIADHAEILDRFIRWKNLFLSWGLSLVTRYVVMYYTHDAPCWLHLHFGCKHYNITLLFKYISSFSRTISRTLLLVLWNTIENRKELRVVLLNTRFLKKFDLLIFGISCSEAMFECVHHKKDAPLSDKGFPLSSAATFHNRYETMRFDATPRNNRTKTTQAYCC